MNRKTLRLLALSAVVTLVASSAFGFVLLSPPRTWDCSPNVIVDDRGVSSISDPDGGVAATVAAITSNQAWNGAVSGTLLTAEPGPMDDFTLGDGIPMLNFQDPINACNGNCLAATFTGFYQERDDGSFQIFDADIVTNSGGFNWTSEDEPDGCASEFYIEGVQVHEVGHLLGLGHTNVSGATMFPSVSSCNNGPASTEADDNAGIVALYGSSAPGCSGNPGGNPGGGCELGQKGDPCNDDADCCSGKCKGKPGSKTCK